VTNPWIRKAKPKGKLSLLGGKAKDNGKAPVKPSLASLSKGEPTPTKPSLKTLTGVKHVDTERPYQEPKPRVKEDFRVDGVLFSGAEITGQFTAGYRDGMFRPIGTVDVTNGDLTFTMHNRYGSWMHDVWRGGGVMAEPARVAAWLGVHSMSQAAMSSALSRRFEAELKKQGVLTTHQQRARVDAAAAEARKRPAKPTTTKETPKVTSGKISLKGLKK
jgi:hypothetical protein